MKAELIAEDKIVQAVFIYYRVQASLFYDVLVYSGSSKKVRESKRKYEHCQGREDRVKACVDSGIPAETDIHNTELDWTHQFVLTIARRSGKTRRG